MSRTSSRVCRVVGVAQGVGAAVLALAIAGPAQAQDDSPPMESTTTSSSTPAHHQPVEMGVFGGVHFFEELHGLGRGLEEPSDNAPNHGGAFGLRLGYHPLSWFGFEIEGMVSPTNTRGDATSMLILGYRGQLVLTLPAHPNFMPFALAGFGALSSFPDDTDIVPEDTDPMFHLGLGAKFPITPKFGLRLDGRVMSPAAVLSDVAEVGDEIHFDGPDWEVLASVYLAFGGRPEVVKTVTLAPPPPPPVDQDPDRDGILGDADRCPKVAEDKDGFEDEDGCPEEDNDRDGIPDAQDKCPNEAETKNGIQDEDGCPEGDKDGDGILDPNDKCVDMPETKNQYQDEDGCPDEIPAAVKKFTGVIQGINFKTGSADILRGSNAVLDRAVAVLKEFSDVKLEISGHTDDVGTNAYNQDLSQRRADSVKNYIVGKGIPDARLKTMGHGEEAPIADNKTKEGKAKNRRTEFKLIN